MPTGQDSMQGSATSGHGPESETSIPILDLGKHSAKPENGILDCRASVFLPHKASCFERGERKQRVGPCFLNEQSHPQMEVHVGSSAPKSLWLKEGSPWHGTSFCCLREATCRTSEWPTSHGQSTFGAGLTPVSKAHVLDGPFALGSLLLFAWRQRFWPIARMFSLRKARGNKGCGHGHVG